MRDFLIRALGGMTPSEADALKFQISQQLDDIKTSILELNKPVRAAAVPDEPNHSDKSEPTRAPIRTLSEPWSIRKKRLEAEDIRRMKDEKALRNQVSGSRS